MNICIEVNGKKFILKKMKVLHEDTTSSTLLGYFLPCGAFIDVSADVYWNKIQASELVEVGFDKEFYAQ